MLNLEELLAKENYLDGTHGWDFCNGQTAIAKAKRLAKSGYTIYEYDLKGIEGERTAEGLKEFVARQMRKASGSCVVGFFQDIYDYVDRKEKIYYVRFGAFRLESLFC